MVGRVQRGERGRWHVEMSKFKRVGGERLRLVGVQEILLKLTPGGDVGP